MTQKSKQLYNLVENGCHTQTNLLFNIKTEHITIVSSFHGYKSKPINKQSTNYLGITCAEQVLSKVFKNVQTMTYGNKGFDFICNKGFKVDSKASTKHKKYNSWTFSIKQNKIPDYFICLAFDNRNDINPLYAWLIPGSIINEKTRHVISESTMNKYNKYKLDINKIIKCCNKIKGGD